jgi:hypothetical protein
MGPRALRAGVDHADFLARAIMTAIMTAIEVFRVRAEARAILFAGGEMALHEAVDPLQDAAVESGLVDLIGQDGVQRLLAEAFRGVR